MNISDALKGMKIIRETAKRYGQTETEVRREMQEALDAAWVSDDPSARALRELLFPDGKPCLEEFIVTLARYCKPN